MKREGMRRERARMRSFERRTRKVRGCVGRGVGTESRIEPEPEADTVRCRARSAPTSASAFPFPCRIGFLRCPPARPLRHLGLLSRSHPSQRLSFSSHLLLQRHVVSVGVAIISAAYQGSLPSPFIRPSSLPLSLVDPLLPPLTRLLPLIRCRSDGSAGCTLL